MPFEPGQPKPANSGRKPGVPNKRTLVRVEDVLVKHRINPVEEILKLLPQLQPHQQVKVHMELLSYCAAKPKPIEEPPEDPTKDVTPVLTDSQTDELLSLVKKPK